MQEWKRQQKPWQVRVKQIPHLIQHIKREQKQKNISEGIKLPDTLDNSLAPKLNSIHNAKIAVESKGSYLEQHKASLTHRNEVNLVIV